MKTSELTGPALDWAVAKCEGILEPIHGEPKPRVVLYVDEWQKYMRLNPPPQVYYSDRYEPSTDWAQGGPIIDRERQTKNVLLAADTSECQVTMIQGATIATAYGPTPLIAAMRCYVASKLGDEVDVPEELI